MIDPWLDGVHFLRKCDVVYPVRFGHTKVSARLYEMDILAKDGRKNVLHLFDLEGVKEEMVEAGGIGFDPCDITRNLTLFIPMTVREKENGCGSISSISCAPVLPNTFWKHIRSKGSICVN